MCIRIMFPFSTVKACSGISLPEEMLCLRIGLCNWIRVSPPILTPSVSK